jgi:hypothetical protein
MGSVAYGGIGHFAQLCGHWVKYIREAYAQLGPDVFKLRVPEPEKVPKRPFLLPGGKTKAWA